MTARGSLDIPTDKKLVGALAACVVSPPTRDALSAEETPLTRPTREHWFPEPS